ncbi:hypothetical protein V9T40_003459 [Parthenolecanium corni]|uniref:Uncharacterized protein n=1 Tax=Parthenolecanium corni TaxID=536013 RepID=A0AAN9TVC8_9HEMI
MALVLTHADHVHSTDKSEWVVDLVLDNIAWIASEQNFARIPILDAEIGHSKFFIYYNLESWLTTSSVSSYEIPISDLVIMGDRPAAERACKDPNPIIDGRKANVNLAILGAKPRVIPPSKLLMGYYRSLISPY